MDLQPRPTSLKILFAVSFETDLLHLFLHDTHFVLQLYLFWFLSGQGRVGDQRACFSLQGLLQILQLIFCFSRRGTVVLFAPFYSNGEGAFFIMRDTNVNKARLSECNWRHCSNMGWVAFHCLVGVFATAAVQRNDWPFSITTGVLCQFVARHIFYWKDTHGNLLSDGCFPTALCRPKGLEKSTI